MRTSRVYAAAATINSAVESCCRTCCRAPVIYGRGARTIPPVRGHVRPARRLRFPGARRRRLRDRLRRVGRPRVLEPPRPEGRAVPAARRPGDRRRRAGRERRSGGHVVPDRIAGQVRQSVGPAVGHQVHQPHERETMGEHMIKHRVPRSGRRAFLAPVVNSHKRAELLNDIIFLLYYQQHILNCILICVYIYQYIYIYIYRYVYIFQIFDIFM